MTSRRRPAPTAVTALLNRSRVARDPSPPQLSFTTPEIASGGGSGSSWGAEVFVFSGQQELVLSGIPVVDSLQVYVDGLAVVHDPQGQAVPVDEAPFTLDGSRISLSPRFPAAPGAKVAVRYAQ